MAEAEYRIEKELEEWLEGAERVVVAGIGNPIRMDDFVGVKVVQDLKGKATDRVMLIECETIPESYMQQITDFNPTHTLLIDAALMGLKPGDSRLTDPEQLIDFPALSTHLLPLRIFCEYLTKTTKTAIALLLIEPKSTDFGEGLSPEIQVSAENITNTLRGLLMQK